MNEPEGKKTTIRRYLQKTPEEFEYFIEKSSNLSSRIFSCPITEDL